MRTHRQAFTLVEILATTLLATLLMLAVLACIPAIARTNVSRGPSPSAEDVCRLVRWDLANARRFESNSGGVKLWGFDALDRATLAPIHRPVAVTYRVETFDGVSWLIRSQAIEGGGTSSQLICSNVGEFSLTAMPEAGERKNIASTQPSTRPLGEFDRGRGEALPGRIEARLTSSSGIVEFQRVICLR